MRVLHNLRCLFVPCFVFCFHLAAFKATSLSWNNWFYSICWISLSVDCFVTETENCCGIIKLDAEFTKFWSHKQKMKRSSQFSDFRLKGSNVYDLVTFCVPTMSFRFLSMLWDELDSVSAVIAKAELKTKLLMLPLGKLWCLVKVSDMWYHLHKINFEIKAGLSN